MQPITLVFILTKALLADACQVLKKSPSLPYFEPDALVRTLSLALKASPNFSAEGNKNNCGAQ